MQNRMRQYMQDINQIPLISKEEEIALAKRRDEGDEDAKIKLIASNLRLVVKIAHDYLRRGVSLDDLISEGNIGLMKAAEKFDPEKGSKFSSYAGWWINQRMRNKVKEKSRVIRLPSTYLNKLNKIKYKRHILTEELNREPTLKELSDYTDFSQKEIKNLLKYEHCEISLQDPILNGENKSIEEIIGSNDESFKDNENKDSLKRIKRLIKYLDEREQYIISNRFGLNGEVKTLEEISEKIEITRERVRQIQNRSLQKLKKKLKEEDEILKYPREYVSKEFFEDDKIPLYSFLTPEEKIIIYEHNQESVPTLIDLSEILESTISYAKDVENKAMNKIKGFIAFKLTFAGKLYSVNNENMIYGIVCKSNLEKEIKSLKGEKRKVLENLYIKHNSYKETAKNINSIPSRVEVYETEGLKEICRNLNLI